MENRKSDSHPAVLERREFETLFATLRRQGYSLVGPTVRDGAIIYDELSAVADLPVGWTDVQEGGTYRLKRRNDQALFGYNVGPHSWKRLLFPPETRLWRSELSAGGFQILQETPDIPRQAFIGVRSCELHAIAIQDRVFLDGQFVDPTYRARRENSFIVAVNCGQAGGTCFCVSMNSGPRAESGFDLALTEVLESDRHCFLIEAGSDAGAAVLAELPLREVTPADRAAAERVWEQAVRQQGRQLDTSGIKELLYRNTEHPRWDDVAQRCLTCANCTMVCPTCFCSTVEDVTDVTGEHAERWRKWDSCFTMDHSYLHGGSVRSSARSRYRQWMTHKLATWIDQFGTSGCVGCGRCITWCPVAIDITEEVAAIRATDQGSADLPVGGTGE